MVVEPLLLPWDYARPLSLWKEVTRPTRFRGGTSTNWTTVAPGFRFASDLNLRRMFHLGRTLKHHGRACARGTAQDFDAGRQGAAMGDVISLEQRRGARLAINERA